MSSRAEAESEMSTVKISAAPRAPVENTASAREAPRRNAFADLALSGVYEISKLLTSPRRLEVILRDVVSVLSSFLDMRRGMIVMLEDQGEPEIVCTAGGWSHEAERAPPLPQGAIDQIVATATPLVVGDISTHALFQRSGYLASTKGPNRVSFIGVPIKVDDRVRGTLSIDRAWDGHSEFRFDQDVRFLVMVANLVGQAVRMQMLVSTDRDRLIVEQHRLQKEVSRLAQQQASQAPPRGGAKASRAEPVAGAFAGIVGESPTLRRVMEQVRLIAGLNTAVLLRGETGTGKELFAKAIHDGSRRAKQPFVKLNCAALPESVIESELFGHEKGAFTGAVSQRKGRFELAHNGTIFLDEIGEISGSFQAKLLRVLQEGEFERVGGATTIKVDIRLICATNRNLEDMVATGAFRADLYYRINVIAIQLPPLRERVGDIPKLAKRFLEQFNAENGRELEFEPDAVDTLAHCYFPGNVRELENCVRRAASLAQGQTVTAHDLACQSGVCLSATLWKGRGAHTGPAQPATAASQILPVGALKRAAPAPIAEPPSGGAEEPAPPCCGDPETCADQERCGVRRGPTEKQKLIAAMEKSGWVQAKAARLLGLTARQIGYALRKHEIDIERL
jgi:Nif-specific regulatory protein